MGNTEDILYELESIQWEASRQQRHDIQNLLNRPQKNIKFERRNKDRRSLLDLRWLVVCQILHDCLGNWKRHSMSKEALKALGELWDQKPRLGELDTDAEEDDPDEVKLDYKRNHNTDFDKIHEYGIDCDQRFVLLRNRAIPPNEIAIDDCGNMHQRIPVLGLVCRGLFATIWNLSFPIHMDVHFRVEVCHYNIRPLERFCKMQQTLRERCRLRPTERNTVLSFRGNRYEDEYYSEDDDNETCELRMWTNRSDNLRWWLEKYWFEDFPLYCTNTARFVIEKVIPITRANACSASSGRSRIRRFEQIEAPEVTRWFRLVQLLRQLDKADTEAFHSILKKLEEDFLVLVEPDTGEKMEIDEGGHDSRDSDEESRTILGDQETKVDEDNSSEEEIDEEEKDAESLFDIVVRVIKMLEPSYREENFEGELKQLRQSTHQSVEKALQEAIGRNGFNAMLEEMKEASFPVRSD